MEPTEGGGAFNFSFSARASASLPFSTHILSCSTSSQCEGGRMLGNMYTAACCITNTMNMSTIMLC